MVWQGQDPAKQRLLCPAIFLLETMENLNESVLTVAFNKAASLEMNERFIRLYKRPDERCIFQPFTAFATKLYALMKS